MASSRSLRRFGARRPVRSPIEDELPKSWDDARPRLSFATRTRTNELSLRSLTESLDPSSFGTSIRAELHPESELELVLMLECDHVFVRPDRRQIETWGGTLELAIDAAHERLGEELDRAWDEIGPGVYRSPWRRRDDAARLLRPDLVGYLPPVTGSPVLLVSGADALLLAGDADPDAIERACRFGEATFAEDCANAGLSTDRATIDLPVAGGELPFRWDGERFRPTRFASLSPKLAHLDEQVADQNRFAFAVAAKFARDGLDLGEPIYFDDRPPEAIDGVAYAMVVRMDHHVPASEYVARGVPVPDHLTPVNLLVVELDASGPPMLLPAGGDWLMIPVVAKDGTCIAARYARLEALRAHAPSWFRPCRISGVDMLLYRAPTDDAVERRPDLEIPTIAMPPTWEGPYALAGLDPIYDDPEEEAFVAEDPWMVDARAKKQGRPGRIAFGILVAVVALVIFGMQTKDGACRRIRDDLVVDWQGLAEDCDASGHPEAAAVYRRYATDASLGIYVHHNALESIPESVVPLSDRLVNRADDLIHRSTNAYLRCH